MHAVAQAARLAPPKLLLSGLRKQQESRATREERHRERVIERAKKQVLPWLTLHAAIGWVNVDTLGISSII